MLPGIQIIIKSMDFFAGQKFIVEDELPMKPENRYWQLPLVESWDEAGFVTDYERLRPGDENWDGEPPDFSQPRRVFFTHFCPKDSLRSSV